MLKRRGVKGMAVRGERSSGREPRPPPSTTFNTRAFRLARPAPRAAKEHDVHAGLGHNVRQLLRTRGHRPGSSIRSPPSHAHNAGRDRRDREPACRAGAEGERRRQKDQCHFCERDRGYIRGGGVGIHRFWAILGSAAQVRIGTLDCKFDPGCKFDRNPNRDTACTSLQVWSSVQVW